MGETSAAGRLSDTGSQKGVHLGRRGSDGRISTLGTTQYAGALRRGEDARAQSRLPSAGEAGGCARPSAGGDRSTDRGVAKQRPRVTPGGLCSMVGVARGRRSAGRVYCPFNHLETSFKPTG